MDRKPVMLKRGCRIDYVFVRCTDTLYGPSFEVPSAR
jgi:hypothetical protein